MDSDSVNKALRILGGAGLGAAGGYGLSKLLTPRDQQTTKKHLLFSGIGGALGGIVGNEYDETRIDMRSAAQKAILETQERIKKQQEAIEAAQTGSKSAYVAAAAGLFAVRLLTNQK